MQSISEILAQELNCKQEYIENVIALLDEGNTIPFIARYRKEQHGAMDDTALRTLETRLQYLRNLAQRREEVKSSIAAQEKLTDELAKAIDEAATLAEVEDLYRPYKPKRRTRATIAKEKGLEPLADAIFAQTLKMDAPVGYSCRAHFGRRGGAQEPAHAYEPARHGAFGSGKGRGGRQNRRLPAVFRVFPAHFPFTKPSGSGTQPRRTRGGLEGQPVR